MLQIEIDDMSGSGISAAGSPEALSSTLLWRILVERRERVTVRSHEDRIDVRDDLTGARLGAWDRLDPPQSCDPAQLDSPEEQAAFLAALRGEGMLSRNRRRCTVPMSAAPPRVFALVTFLDDSPRALSIHTRFDVPRWWWRLRKIVSEYR